MYVCLCGGVTESQIKEQVELGAESVADLQKTLPIGLCCGTCDVVADQFIKSGSAYFHGLLLVNNGNYWPGVDSLLDYFLNYFFKRNTYGGRCF